MPLKLGLGLSPVLAADRLPFTPLQLSNLRAWYDAELGQPKYGGAGAYVQLDGTSGDYIFTPDSAATSFSNDIEVVMRVKVTDWTAAANQTLAGKYVSTGNQRSWRFYVSAAGAIGLSVSTDGTSGAVTTVSVTPTNALPDNTWIWLRMRLDLTNGSNSVGTLDTATDTGNNTEPSSWTANGTNTGTTISGIFDSTAPTEIGTFAAGTLERLTGQVGRCIVRNGFGGTTVADFNASDCYGDGYWHSGGYRWTLGLPKIYDRSGNNVAPATFGSGSNQPEWLPWEGRSQVRFPDAANNYADVTVAGIGTGQFTVVLDGYTDNWNDSSGTHRYVAYARNDEGQITFMTVAGLLRLYGGTGNITSSGHPSGGRVQWRLRKTDASNGEIAWRVDGVTDPSASGWTVSASGAISGGTTGGGVRLGDTSGAPRFTCYGVAAYNSAGTKVWEFAPALCGQSGYTDPVSGQAWVLTRATAGKKAVVQSPTAASDLSVILLATDDWIDVPAAAVPALDTFAAASSVTASFRRWHNPGASNFAIFTSKASAGNTVLGMALRLFTTAASPLLGVQCGDGSANDGYESAGNLTVPFGARAVASVSVGDSNPFITAVANDGAAGSDTARGTTVTTSTGGAGRIGAYLGGTAPIDMEFQALVLRDAATSDTEHGLQVAYYGGGL